MKDKAVKEGKKNHMIFYIENPKEATEKLLELKDEFSKVSGYKICTQNQLSIVFLYTCNSENKIKKAIIFTISSKWIEYLGLNLTKDVQNLCSAHYRTLKEIKEVLKNRKHLCSGMGRLNIVSMAILSQPIYRFNTISIRISADFFVEISKLILKFL